MAALDCGVINKDKTITYVAVPYPLPTAWQNELRMVKKGDQALLDSIEIRCRKAIGVQVTRAFIPSTSEAR